MKVRLLLLHCRCTSILQLNILLKNQRTLLAVLILIFQGNRFCWQKIIRSIKGRRTDFGKTGAAVTIVENGLQCTELFTGSAKGSFDAILMDIQMPIMNGYEAAQAIRSSTHPQSATIPIIAMTANAFAEDIKNALSAGMNAHIAKPIDPQKLYETLAAYIK